MEGRGVTPSPSWIRQLGPNIVSHGILDWYMWVQSKIVDQARIDFYIGEFNHCSDYLY